MIDKGRETVQGVARRVGLPARTVRYYDARGIVTPARSPAGYRLYGEREAEQLRAVKLMREFGLSLAQIRERLERHPNGTPGRALIVEVLDERIIATREHLADLERQREARLGEGASNLTEFDERVQMMMLRVADPAYFDALKRGEVGAQALREAVAATMRAMEGGDQGLPIERIEGGHLLIGGRAEPHVSA